MVQFDERPLVPPEAELPNVAGAEGLRHYIDLMRVWRGRGRAGAAMLPGWRLAPVAGQCWHSLCWLHTRSDASRAARATHPRRLRHCLRPAGLLAARPQGAALL